MDLRFLPVFAVCADPRLQRHVRQSAGAGQPVRLQREEEKEQRSLLQISAQLVATSPL